MAPIMTATSSRWTVERLEREGPPDGLWELIDGELIAMSPSGRAAGKLAVWIGSLLLGFVLPHRLGEVFGADTGFVLVPGRQLLRSPDVAFVRADRLVAQDDRGYLHLAPDLAIEVRSPTDRTPDVLAKVEMYIEAGVRLVWLVDPDPRTVAVFGGGQDGRVLQGGDWLDGGDVLPGLRIDLAELFRPL